VSPAASFSFPPPPDAWASPCVAERPREPERREPVPPVHASSVSSSHGQPSCGPPRGFGAAKGQCPARPARRMGRPTRQRRPLKRQRPRQPALAEALTQRQLERDRLWELNEAAETLHGPADPAAVGAEQNPGREGKNPGSEI
jgi:hypothetical protein